MAEVVDDFWQRHQRHGRLEARQRGRRHRRGVGESEAIAENATAGDVILRVLDLVLLLSERFFGSFLPDFVEIVAGAAENAQKALADPLAESKSTSLLGGVKSTLPDEEEEAGRQRKRAKARRSIKSGRPAVRPVEQGATMMA